MAEKLKDLLFTPATVNAMADVLAECAPSFVRKRFIALVLDDAFEGMELKARMRHTTRCLRQVLPRPFEKALAILEKAAPRVKGFEAMCLPDFVELYGQNDWKRSLPALALFTKYSSSEFAIRPFIIDDARRAMAFMETLADDDDEKVRRFASEGCRPRLPWAMAIGAFKKDPRMILPVLEKLKDDDSLFVRRSVANNLNDISKDHPGVVLKLCKEWSGKSPNTDWIIKHACRTLLKAGNRRAMTLFGFGDPRTIAVKKLKVDKPKAAIGETVRFSFALSVGTARACKVRLEYAVRFVKARGKVSRKVFKISERSCPPGERVIEKKHSFADMSTRRHYPGEHPIEIIVNGKTKAETSLVLTDR